MLSSQWHKVLNDLCQNKTRTFLVVLSMAVGLFAVGTIVSARSILATEMARSYASINPGSGTLRTAQLFEEDLLQSVRGMKDVADADARRTLEVRLKVDAAEWRPLKIFAVSDYDQIRVNKIKPQLGAWPPPKRELLIERAALDLIGAHVGDTVLIETPGRKQRSLRIAGLVHDMAQLPSQFDNAPYGYITFDTLEWLGEPRGFNELYVVAARGADKIRTLAVLNRVKDRIEQNGFIIPPSTSAEPGSLPLDDILQTILLLMAMLGLLSLGLSAFLIVNTISSLMAEQVRQIGVMKAIGARTGQLLRMYLVMVTLYGVMALAIAVPLGMVGSRALSQVLAGMFNFDLARFRITPLAIGLQVGVGILVPILASLYPFMSSLRVTAAEAMSSYGLDRGRAAAGWFDRLLSGANLWFARSIPLRPLLLSLRNTFRRKGRLALTLTTLALAGATFISVFSVRASISRTIDDIMRLWGFDSMITFEQPYRLARLREQALAVPGVTDADVWLQMPVRRVRSDKSESGVVNLFAPHAGSALVPPPVMMQGRWLLPDDENAVVVNSYMLKDEPDIRVGDEIVLKIRGHERAMRVVGVSLGAFAPFAYVNYPYLAPLTASTDRSDTLLISTDRHDGASVSRVASALQADLKRAGLRVSVVQTTPEERAKSEANFGIVVTLMLVMAVLLALVGGLGLMGTMSINVIERTREIGVLRAIGASSGSVARVFVFEGVLIGVLSWVISLPVALPMSRLICGAVGDGLMGMPLTFSFSTSGAWLWLLLVLSLSALASFLPARHASRLTVREVLAYE